MWPDGMTYFERRSLGVSAISSSSTFLRMASGHSLRLSVFARPYSCQTASLSASRTNSLLTLHTVCIAITIINIISSKHRQRHQHITNLITQSRVQLVVEKLTWTRYWQRIDWYSTTALASGSLKNKTRTSTLKT